MSAMRGQSTTASAYTYSMDWDVFFNTTKRFFMNNQPVLIIPTILHFVSQPTFPFVLGAVLVNTCVLVVRLAWRNGLYENYFGAAYYEAIRPQRYYIGTRLALIGVTTPIKHVFRIAFYFPASIVVIIVSIASAYKAELFGSINQDAIITRLFGYSNHAILYTVWLTGVLCHLVVKLLTSTSQLLWFIKAQLYQCYYAVLPHRAPSKPYHYIPLQPGSIRLLMVHRVWPFFGLRTSLITTTIASAPPYEAISYTWGTKPDIMHLNVDDQMCQISIATYDAIYGCSSIWQSKLLWIDYLCINQKDVNEKAEQVSSMTKIYESAQQVIVYLGRFTWDSILPLSLFWDIFHHVEAETDEQWVYRRYESEVMLPRWGSLVTFFNHAWFSRAWVIQEVACAQRVVVYYGGLAFDWSTFMYFADFFRPSKIAHLLQIPQYGRSAYNNISNMRRLNSLRINMTSQRIARAAFEPLRKDRAMWSAISQALKKEDFTSKWDVLDQQVARSSSLQLVLTQNSHFNTTDPRDKIYALQGLVYTPIPPNLLPNYKKPIEALFLDVAKHFWESPDPFSTIAWAGIGHDRKLDLPSWAIDWTSSPKCPPLTSPGYDEGPRPELNYATSGDTKPQISLDAVDGGAVTVLGVFVDKVQSLARTCAIAEDYKNDYIVDGHGSTIYPGDFLDQYHWHNEVAEMSLKNVPPDDLIAHTDAVWRTLIGDITDTERPAPPDLALTYAFWALGLEYMKNWVEERDKNPALPMPDSFWEFLNVGAIWAPRFAMGSVGKRFCITEQGYMGQVLPNSQVGDVICIAYGARTPWTLRPVLSETSKDENESAQLQYRFVGECFMYGMMDGEKVNGGPAQSFTLV